MVLSGEYAEDPCRKCRRYACGVVEKEKTGKEMRIGDPCGWEVETGTYKLFFSFSWTVFS